jgi:type IV pilus assembly protein PilQ
LLDFPSILKMLSRNRLTTTWKAAAGTCALLLCLFTACKHTRDKPPPAPPKVKYSETYDAEIKEIMALARQNRWEEAETKAQALYYQAPRNPSVDRVHSWVFQERQKIREQALENEIREIDAKNSVFNPTLESLATEQKDRGLPARKDVRDTVARIESAPYIPDTYGKVVREKGPLFDFESTRGEMSKVLDREVTVHLDNVPLETILLSLSQTAGVNIVADKALAQLKQVLSVHLDKVRLGEFLRYVYRNYDLQFQVGDDLVWVSDAKDPKRLVEETRFYRLRKGFVLPAAFGAQDVERRTTTVDKVTTVTETQKIEKFVNDDAPRLPALERAITNLFTGSKYFIDYERNLVVARGTPEQLDVMEEIIREFDKPIQQVLIEARFVTVSRPVFLQLGVLWETDRQIRAARTPQDFTALINSQNIPLLGVGIQETFTNVFGVGELSATISALEQSGESQTLSSPRLTVLNNLPARISDGKVQYYYEEYQVKSTVQQYYTASSFVPSGKPTKITAGATLNVLASISGDGKSIVLALNPIVNTDVQLVKFATLTDYTSDGRVQNTFDINLPQYRTQELNTRVAINSGETVVMGGVIERARSTYVESVPVLGDLPIIGVLFRRRTEQDVPRYLLVFVTATIVKETGEFLIYDPETGNTITTNSVPGMR